MLGAGAAVGMTPVEVKACAVWEYDAAVAGWINATCPDDKASLTPKDQDDLWEGVMARMH